MPPGDVQTQNPDQCAAHEFLAELRTRIATQPIPYQYGVEGKALESLWEVFNQARQTIKKYPGCRDFADSVTQMLNEDLRPVTAKWDCAHQEGRLNSRDGADEFRVDLEHVQARLREFSVQLRTMAYPESEIPQELDRPAISEQEIGALFAPIVFGICPSWIDPESKRDKPTKVMGAFTRIRMNTYRYFEKRNPASLAVKGTTLEINAAEREEVEKRRTLNQIPSTTPGLNAIGLALSGGGIRSATFSLGVTQVLADRGILKQIDFLSTVSGGGYIGSFLTTRLGDLGPARSPEEANERLKDLVGNANGLDPDPIQYVRRRAQYLSSASLLALWNSILSTMAGMLLNWMVPLLFVAAAALIARGIQLLWPVWRWHDFVYEGLGVGALVCLLALVLYPILIRMEGKVTSSEIGLLRWAPIPFIASAAGWLVWKGYLGFERLLYWLDGPENSVRFLTVSGLLSIVAASSPIVMRFLPIFRSPKYRAVGVKFALGTAGLLVPLSALMSFYILYYAAGLRDVSFLPSIVSPWLSGGYVGVFVLVFIPSLIVALALNVNATSPHLLYRNRLARTFVRRNDTDPDIQYLAKMNSDCSAPYHLINATLNLPASEAPEMRDRKCDFFVFSKRWCGSRITGYLETEHWKRGKGENFVLNRSIELATAMAVSGAAASPHMGLGTRPGLRALLTVLNVRLGFWLRRPDRPAQFHVPGFVCLFREMTNMWMDEHATWINLSDGGHIENLAVYELLRRRCKFIVCVDGESDDEFKFHGLMTLVRHAQIDFGIRIEPRLEELRPDEKTTFCQAHYTFCRVKYPKLPGTEEEIGLLLYMKLSLTGDESALVQQYHRRYPKFPHQTTADQFFDQEQFEAYRQLGVHVASGLFSEALLGEHDHRTSTTISVEDWFRHLARNLLLPDPERPRSKEAALPAVAAPRPGRLR